MCLGKTTLLNIPCVEKRFGMKYGLKNNCISTGKPILRKKMINRGSPPVEMQMK